MALADELELLFLARDYRFKIGGERVNPTADDIQGILDHAQEVIDKEPGDTVQLEIGRLLIRKREGSTDVFVYFGELKDVDE